MFFARSEMGNQSLKLKRAIFYFRSFRVIHMESSNTLLKTFENSYLCGLIFHLIERSLFQNTVEKH